MNPSSQGSGPSTPPTVTITVNSSDGTLSINKGTTTMNTANDNPSAGWTKKTYTNTDGTFNITVSSSASDKKNLDVAIQNENSGVEELYHYINSTNHVLKLKKDKNYYIYYIENNNSNWEKLTSVPVGNAKEPAVGNVINDHLSNRVEIQLEKQSGSYGLTSVPGKEINVAANNGGTPVKGYNYYKHSRTSAFKIEKVRYKGSEIYEILPIRTNANFATISGSGYTL